MKISAYYKSKKHIVKMIYDIRKINSFDKVYFYKSITPIKDVYKGNFLNEKIIFIGDKFYKKSPLEKDILKCSPDKSIYLDYMKLNEKRFKKSQRNRLKKILSDDTYLTFMEYEDYKNKDFYNCNKIIIFDNSFFEEWIKKNDIDRIKDKKIIFKEPQFFNEIVTLEKIKELNIKSLTYKNTIVYTGDLNKKTFTSLMDYFQYPWAIRIKNCSPDKTIENFIVEELIEKGNYYLKGCSKNFHISFYKNSSLPEDEPYVKLINRYCMYTQINKPNSIKSFFSFLKEEGSSHLLEIIFNLSNNYPSLRPIFFGIPNDFKKIKIWIWNF